MKPTADVPLDPEIQIIQMACAPFVKHCRCGRNWNVVMERGRPDHHGCLRCSCNEELVAWSGTVMFNAFPADAD
jgi:hypothetical protein